MKSLLKFDDGLSDDIPIYRIVDFFAAADTIKNNRLRISRADMFSDKNEGVGILLNQMQISKMTDALGMGWTDRESAEQSHLAHKQSHYISCWTEAPESVAMWSLYSTDKCSIRLKTSIGKIKKAVEGFINERSLLLLKPEDINKIVVTAVSGSIYQVKYESLSQLTKQVQRRSKAYERIYTRFERKGVSAPSIPDIPQRYFEREKYRRFRQLDNEFYLKDISYQHEREVRIVIAMAERKCSDQLLNEINEYKNEKKYDMSILLRSCKGGVFKNKLNSFAFAKCCESFVDEVTIDPRCEEHKRRFMLDWFNGAGVRVGESNSFGYVPDYFDLFPGW